MFKHNWTWIKLATDNFSTVLTRNLRNPRDCTPLKQFLKMTVNTETTMVNHFGLACVLWKWCAHNKIAN